MQHRNKAMQQNKKATCMLITGNHQITTTRQSSSTALLTNPLPALKSGHTSYQPATRPIRHDHYRTQHSLPPPLPPPSHKIPLSTSTGSNSTLPGSNPKAPTYGSAAPPSSTFTPLANRRSSPTPIESQYGDACRA